MCLTHCMRTCYVMHVMQSECCWDWTSLRRKSKWECPAHNSPGGGGGEILCLPLNPDYIWFNDSRTTTATFCSVLHGGEYDTFNGPQNALGNQNVACAVCLATTRATMTMVPAKTQCPSSWTREYYGYLIYMAERENGVQFSQSSYTCIDITPDTVQGEAGDTAGTYFTYVVAACTDGIPCPQYICGQPCNILCCLYQVDS